MEAYKNTFKENVKHKKTFLFAPRNVLEKYFQIVFIAKQMYVHRSM